jgi:hypothetical protein
MPCKEPTIETIRGRSERADGDVLAFWAAHGGPSGDAAQRRLPEAVCALRCGGELAGVSSVHAAEVALIGGRRFWIYESCLAVAAGDQWVALMRATFNALEAKFDGERGAPIGLCALLTESERRLAPAEAEWSDPRTIYAGYLGDGRQVRIAYFEGAEITAEDAYA